MRNGKAISATSKEIHHVLARAGRTYWRTIQMDSTIMQAIKSAASIAECPSPYCTRQTQRRLQNISICLTPIIIFDLKMPKSLTWLHWLHWLSLLSICFRSLLSHTQSFWAESPSFRLIVSP